MIQSPNNKSQEAPEMTQEQALTCMRFVNEILESYGLSLRVSDTVPENIVLAFDPGDPEGTAVVVKLPAIGGQNG